MGFSESVWFAGLAGSVGRVGCAVSAGSVAIAGFVGYVRTAGSVVPMGTVGPVEARGSWVPWDSWGPRGPRGLWAQVGFVVRFVGYMGRRVRGAVGSVGSWDPLSFLGSLRSVATVESEGPGRLRGPWGGRVCGVPGIREVRESAGIVGSLASVCYPRRTDFRSSSDSWGSWAP